jgi:hypothetical protein
MMVIIDTAATIITPVLLPNAMTGAALLPALADHHCCQPTPTTDHERP